MDLLELCDSQSMLDLLQPSKRKLHVELLLLLYTTLLELVNNFCLLHDN